MSFNFKNVVVKILKLKAGESFIGKLTSTSNRDWLDRKSGEMKTIKQFHFDLLSEETGEVSGQIIYFGDGGFSNAMSMADIKENDIIKVVKQAKSDIGQGRLVNNYEIFKAN
jgi:hypothetical protein